MKKWYTAAELAGVAGMPKTVQGVNARAKREDWLYRYNTSSRGGGREYYFESLPDDTRDDLFCRASAEILPILPAHTKNIVATADARAETGSLKKWQRDVLTARLALYRKFEELKEIHGTTEAADKLVKLAKAEMLPENLQNMVRIANARRGNGRTLSRSTILGWQRKIRRYGEAALAPKQARKEQLPEWAPYFHKVYNRPQKPSIPEAMRELEHILPEHIQMPSYHQLRRYHHKRSRLEREKGRHSPSALKRFRGYIQRSTDNLLPLDVVQCDGHSFKAKVAHPVHGRPFKPEVCAVIDVKTKMCLGWSTGLAESAHTVADALRNAMTVNDQKPWGGVPAILYTDNGAGNMAHILSDEVTGVLARAGITHKTGIPGNAQGRGLVEKTNQRLWISAARKLQTFVGKGMDELVKKQVYVALEKEVRNTGTCVTNDLPSWRQFIEFCEQSMRDYNNTPHAGLPKMRDAATQRIRHMTPAEAWFTSIKNGWEPTLLPPEILADLFRPQTVRKAIRGKISLHNNVYYEPILEHYHGEKVIVEYDIHDPSYVRVRDMEQRLICLAHLDRNKKDFFPLSEVEQDRDKRYRGRKKLLERKLEEVEAERSGHHLLDMDIDKDLIIHADQCQDAAIKQAADDQYIDLVKVTGPREDQQEAKAAPGRRLYSTKSERFDAILAALRQSPRPLTPAECAFLDEYYQEDGGRMYMALVGDLRLEYGVEDAKEQAMK